MLASYYYFFTLSPKWKFVSLGLFMLNLYNTRPTATVPTVSALYSIVHFYIRPHGNTINILQHVWLHCRDSHHSMHFHSTVWPVLYFIQRTLTNTSTFVVHQCVYLQLDHLSAFCPFHACFGLSVHIAILFPCILTTSLALCANILHLYVTETNLHICFASDLLPCSEIALRITYIAPCIIYLLISFHHHPADHLTLSLNSTML